MKMNQIKSFVFGLVFLGAMSFGGLPVNGQASVDPGEGNRYGGVCCLNLTETCHHPVYGSVAESEWKVGISFCP